MIPPLPDERDHLLVPHLHHVHTIHLKKKRETVHYRDGSRDAPGQHKQQKLCLLVSALVARVTHPLLKKKVRFAHFCIDF